VEEEKVGGIGLDQGLAAMTAKETIILSCMLLCLLLLATQVFEKPKTVVYKLQYACDPDGRADVLFPFCNTSWSDEDRVTDLISRLTIFEKIENTAPSGVPVVDGVAISPSVHFGGSTPAATSFPSPILSAASYNRTLWNKIAQVGLKFLLGNAVCGKRY
jgi:hypothetical protein